MKAGIYDPYLDTLGGGEKYCLTLAELLLKNDFEVDIFWDGENLKKKIKERLGVDIGKANFIPTSKGIIEKFINLRKYDLLFFMGDGSIPLMFGKRNVLHFQVPFKGIGGNSLLNKLKLRMIHHVICNSKFTQTIIEKEFKVKSEVIYPPVDIDKFKPGEKENIILSVGRFSQLLQVKNQDILIETFKELVDDGLKKWRLILVGGSDVGGESYVKRLRNIARSYPIEIFENVSVRELSKFYSKAKIFWAANGYSVNEEIYPEKVEHFGITVVEAMSAGAIPILVDKGGFREIVVNEKSGFFWQTTKDLKKITIELANEDLKKSSLEARKRSKLFAKEVFNEKFKKIIF